MAALTLKPLNHVLGDSGFLSESGRDRVLATDSSHARISAHLRHVEALLQQTSSAGSARGHTLAHLREYIERSQFPQMPLPLPAGDRLPCFIDDRGTPCAVGYLMQRSGAADLAHSFNELYRFCYLHEVPASETRLADWAESAGLSLLECAMIQPTYDFDRRIKFPTPIPRPSTPPATVVQHEARCDSCGTYPILGIRYKCANCADFDLCSACYKPGAHTDTHVFLKLRRQFIHPTGELLPNLYETSAPTPNPAPTATVVRAPVCTECAHRVATPPPVAPSEHGSQCELCSSRISFHHAYCEQCAAAKSLCPRCGVAVVIAEGIPVEPVVGMPLPAPAPAVPFNVHYAAGRPIP
eukprot:gnl/Spiro4/10797_TR5749_c0_g1_i1.p1 gnl/Spiro4/10797_TR5749_c0_g1~~gnl/Spiro4/10797_TR5749_c0_g1_i1.p1  ORF type:complete len:366 (-),score=65.51 gnl/Spiro4/10797_TR5749_c0_g1_i1:91-1152(-)